ncbi:MAG: glycosyl transferase [Rhodospirillaceae bacterium]|nr:MAG: glycosyl transferase [Rhodospirillaceae bacterium]
MQVEQYSEVLKQARERSLDVMKLLKVAGRLSADGQPQLVAALYRTWIDHNADAPLIHAVYFNYGVVLSGVGDIEGAQQAFKESVRIKPDFFPSYINLGGALDKLGRAGDAIAQWTQIVTRLPMITGDNLNYKTSALKQMGRVLERHNFDEHAEDSLRQGLDIDPHQSDVIQHWLSLRQRQCKWPVVAPWGKPDHTQLMNGFSALSLAAYTDDPLLLLGNAYKYSKNNIGQPAISFADHHAGRRGQNRDGRLKIGYLSSDLREHAIGFLTAEIYGLHDRTKVEIFVYYCGIKAKDHTHIRVKETSEHWLDINSLSDEEAAKQIIADGIDILVDINGYTNGARTKMLSMRPAPIIVNWLGFPGSMGSPYHNYIIADDFIIPKESEIYYAEKVVRLPCYQPNDRHRVISQQEVTRHEVGLPDDAVVYCCFNGLHKITPAIWDSWMAILQQTPGSVLWLLEGIESTNKRLKALAVKAGIDPERLIFAAKKANPEHLARYPLADLFLDTAPYGAHTTSSDALWMGIPVVTLIGRSFASRVCGSLIRSAGLGELVCETLAQFVSLAVDLGLNPEKRNTYRNQLLATRDTCVLFDTPRLVSELETLYRQMWHDFETGNLPRPDLRNLEIYNDIGVEISRENIDLLVAPNYREMYEAKLAEKDSFWHLPPDGRLWTEEAIRRLRKP